MENDSHWAACRSHQIQYPIYPVDVQVCLVEFYQMQRYIG